MAKTKRCRNGKMKKYNKTRKYVKSGGFDLFRKNKPEDGEVKVKKGQDTTKLKRCTVCKKYFSNQEFLEDHQRRTKHAVPIGQGITPSKLGDNILNNFDATLDNILKQHKSILGEGEILENLFKYLTTDNYNKHNIENVGLDWCKIHELTLEEYTNFKNKLENMKNDNPSLVSLIDEIHEKFNEFENGRNEYKDGYCESDGPLPPTPDVRPFRAVRPRASTPQEAAPPPPPRRGKGSGSYKRLGPNRMTRQMSLRKPSTLKSLKTVSTDPYQYPTNIKHLLKNAPYENVSPFRKSSSSKGYNPFFDPKFKN